MNTRRKTAARAGARPWYARRAGEDAARSLSFSPINGILLGLGVLAITVGYYTLAQGSTVLAPLLLVLGYVVLIPLGIIR